MTNALAILALVCLLTGAANAQQKQSGKKTSTSKTGTVSANDAARSNPSAANTHDGTNGASTGTGLTNDQNQAAANPAGGSTKVDANSSVRTSASAVKARKKTAKSNQ